ncbi:MAG: HAD family hydrolase, partial [Pseudomonadota bacterium]
MARIIFDLDGTLVDSAPSLCHAGNALLADLGRAPVDVETYKAFVGRGMPKQVAGLLAHTGGVPGGDLTPHLARFRAVYDADPLIHTVAYPGVMEALDLLRGQGHRLAVCTQKALVPARKVLAGLGLDRLIEGLTGGDSLDVLKPDPAMLWHAAAQIGAGPVVYL